MMIPDDKAVFLKMLASDYNIQQDVVLQLANQLTAAQVSNNISLMAASEVNVIHLGCGLWLL